MRHSGQHVKRKAVSPLLSTDFLKALLDGSMHYVQVFKAVRNKAGRIIDFTWVFTNKLWRERFGNLNGKRFLQEDQTLAETELFKTFVNVVETGIPVDHEHFYKHPSLNGWFHQTLLKMEDGFVMNSEEITERKKSEQELKDRIAQEVNSRYKSLFNSIDEGFCIMEIVYDVDRTIKDLIFREVNSSFLQQTGLEHVIGKTVRELLPDLELVWPVIYIRVAQTGEPTRSESYLSNVQRWFSTHHIRLENSSLVAAVLDNITVRKKAEQALRHSEESARTMTRLVPVLLWETDPTGLIVLRNDSWLRYTAQTLHECQNEGWLEAVHPDDRLATTMRMSQRSQASEDMEMEYRIRRHDGTYRWFLSKQTPVKDRHGRIIKWFGAAIDIHDRRLAEVALKKSEANLVAFIKAIPIAVGMVDCNGMLVNYNKDMQHFLPTHFIPSEDKNRSWRWQAWNADGSLIEPSDFPSARALRGELIVPGIEMLYIHDDGSKMWTRVSAVPIRNEQGEITGTVSAITDINKLKQTTEALRQNEERLKELNENLERVVERRTRELMRLKLKQEQEKLNAVIFAQEQERTRIGEGLHNGVAQLLYAVQNRLAMLQAQSETDDMQLQLASEILSNAINDTRKISFELMPPILKDYGLKMAIQTLLQRIFTEHIHIKLSIALNERLSEKLEISIYRIVQEILNNILKHSGASQAVIRIYITSKNVHLRTEDNGVGFAVKQVKSSRKGVGLQSMENRVKLLSGKMKIRSQVSRGTAIDIQLPL